VLVNVGDSFQALAPRAAGSSIVPGLSSALTGGTLGVASFSKVDSNCTDTLQDKNTEAQSGLVKASSLNGGWGGSLAATDDPTIGTQNDKVSGGFNASFCDISKIPLNPNCE